MYEKGFFNIDKFTVLYIAMFVFSNIQILLWTVSIVDTSAHITSLDSWIQQLIVRKIQKRKVYGCIK